MEQQRQERMAGSVNGNLPAAREKGKRPHTLPSGDFLVEELLPDDMGYDADIEVIRPDKYEDAESDAEDMSTPEKPWHSIDEELATRMRQLGREKLSPVRPSADRGRKRRSIEMYDDESLLRTPRSPELEVQEVTDGAVLPSPAKRRRKKSRRSHAVRYSMRESIGTITDSSDLVEGNARREVDASTASATSGQATPRKGLQGGDDNNDEEMMDVT